MRGLADFFVSPMMKWVLIVLAVLFPLFINDDYKVYVMSMSLVMAIAVYGMNILTGYCGQLNLAHGAFFAVGAYVVAILGADHGWSFWFGFMMAGVFGAVLGFLAGIVSLRLNEHYFAIFTMCVGFIIYVIIDKWDALTNGSVGIMGIPTPEGFGLVDFSETIPFYYLALFLMVVAIWIAGRIGNSILGRTFFAIRNSEELAQSLGINLMKNKLLAFVISTVYASLAGALYAGMVGFIGPDEADVTNTFEMLTFLLIGGIGTLMGPLTGTILVTWLTQFLQFLEEFRMIVFGPLLIILVIVMPKGLVGNFVFWRNRKVAEEETARIAAEQEKLKEKNSA